MFHQLWKAGDTAHLDLDTHAGQAWIGLRTPLGHSGQPRQYPPQTPTHRQYPSQSPTHRSPSYYCRQERRKAAKVADSILNNNKKIPAEEAEGDTTSDEFTTSDEYTEKVNHPHQEYVPEKSEDNPTPEAVKLPCFINERIEHFTNNNNNPTEEVGEIPCDKTTAAVNPFLTAIEVESTIDTNLEESTDTNTTNNKYQCEMCEFRCQWNKSL